MLLYRRQTCGIGSILWLSGTDPEARDRKHIRHIIERPMNAGCYVRVETRIDLYYARFEAEKDGASRSGSLLKYLMRQHCLLYEQRFVIKNRFRAML